MSPEPPALGHAVSLKHLAKCLLLNTDCALPLLELAWGRGQGQSWVEGVAWDCLLPCTQVPQSSGLCLPLQGDPHLAFSDPRAWGKEPGWGCSFCSWSNPTASWKFSWEEVAVGGDSLCDQSQLEAGPACGGGRRSGRDDGGQALFPALTFLGSSSAGEHAVPIRVPCYVCLGSTSEGGPGQPCGRPEL